MQQLSRDTIELAQRCFDQGQITWTSVQKLQDLTMPYCELHHKRATSYRADGTAWCIDCAHEKEAMRKTIITYYEAHRG